MTHLSPQQLSAHLDAALSGASLQLVEHHLQICERCRDELAALTLQDQMLTEALHGENDRELFELIGLRVQSVVHPQRARALEKAIAELERARGERRRHAEAVARRVTEAREMGAGADPGRSAIPRWGEERDAPAAAPGPANPIEPDAAMSPAAELRRRALDEARTRAEAEARAFALESERARDEAERRVLDEAAARARHEAAARRRSEEESRTRAATSARVEAEQLARAAEAALADAETSARDARAARARADARAAAAEEAGRQARLKAEEARRLETELAAAERVRAAQNFLSTPEQPAAPAVLSAEEVAAYREWPDDEAEAPRALRPRRTPPAAYLRREPKRSPALVIAASLVILLTAFWFAFGRPWLESAKENLAAPAAITTPASRESAATTTATPGSESGAPASAPLPAEEARKPRHAPASEAERRSESAIESAAGRGGEPASGTETPGAVNDAGSSADAEPEDEPAVDLGLLCGTVHDDEHRPVAGARVMMAEVGVVVVTDRVGRFCLTAPRGTRTLSVIALGYTTHRQSVSVGRRTSELNVTLRKTR